MIIKQKSATYDRRRFEEVFNGIICPDAESAAYAERTASDDLSYITAYAAYFWMKYSPEKVSLEDPFEEMLNAAIRCEGGDEVKDIIVSFLVWKYNPIKWGSVYKSKLRDLFIKATHALMSKEVFFEKGDFIVSKWGLHEYDHMNRFYEVIESLANTK